MSVHLLRRSRARRYAFRKPHTLTDVVLRELSTKQDVRIKCKDLVKKIALYKNFLAVQLPKSINVYEISQSETGALKVKLPPLKIREAIECSLLVVCSRNLILCLDRRLTSLAFDGSREREWVLDAPIKYIKVVGGPPGCEGLLVGLKNGQVLRYVGLPGHAVRCCRSLTCVCVCLCVCVCVCVCVLTRGSERVCWHSPFMFFYFTCDCQSCRCFSNRTSLTHKPSLTHHTTTFMHHYHHHAQHLCQQFVPRGAHPSGHPRAVPRHQLEAEQDRGC